MDASPQANSEQFPLEIHACERKSNSGTGERQRERDAGSHPIMNAWSKPVHLRAKTRILGGSRALPQPSVR